MLTLNKAIRKIIADFNHPIGEYFETDNLSFDPNKEWTGTWNLENDGTVLVSKSSSSSSKFNIDIGKTVGEETHTLTIKEMPSHSHDGIPYMDWYATPSNTNTGKVCSDGFKTVTGLTGGDAAHNNIQPSKVVNRWHRVA